MSDYTVLRATDAPDYSGGDPSRFLGYARPMGSGQLGLNVRELAPGASNVPPGDPATGGHSHGEVEELYFVLEGDVTVKVDDDEVVLGPRDAVLMQPGAVHMLRNCSKAPAAVLMVSRQVANPREESIWVEDFWPEG